MDPTGPATWNVTENKKQSLSYGVKGNPIQMLG